MGVMQLRSLPQSLLTYCLIAMIKLPRTVRIPMAVLCAESRVGRYTPRGPAVRLSVVLSRDY